jgi:hypothetical protein
MTDLLCASDFTPEPGLFPIAQEVVPHYVVGGKVAFREDHEHHGAETVEGEWAGEAPPRAARYGQIRAVGVNENGLVLDVLVIDPRTGLPVDADTDLPYEKDEAGAVIEGKPTIRRVTLEELQ